MDGQINFIKCANKFYTIVTSNRIRITSRSWRHLKHRSFVFKSFQSCATFRARWRASSFVRVAVYFSRSSLGDQLLKLPKRFVSGTEKTL